MNSIKLLFGISFYSFDARKSGRAKNFKVWKDDNHAICMSDFDLNDRIDYIHKNPVVQEIVRQPEDYIYSNALDFEGGIGKVKIEAI